jgi:DNA polymerase phi
MFDQQDEEDEEDDEDEDMMDVDEVGEGDENEDEDEEEAESSSSSEEENDEDGEEGHGNDEEELAAFDAKLAEALGTHRADKDLEENSDTSSESDMDDDEMEAIDEVLAKVFKTRSQVISKKKDKKDAKENMVNFKNRVLDFLEIYVKKCHGSTLALDLILPLLRLARKSSTQQICQKANGVMREYGKLCKAPAVPSLTDTDAEPVLELLQAIHKEATLSGPPAHASSCSLGSLLVVKVLVAHDKQHILRVVDVYGETRKQQLLNKKCHVKPAFFTEWSNWCQTASAQLRN